MEFYCLCPWAQAINPIQPLWVWYNYYWMTMNNHNNLLFMIILLLLWQEWTLSYLWDLIILIVRFLSVLVWLSHLQILMSNGTIRQPRMFHSATATALCPGLVEVVEFGGSTGSQSGTIAETTIITFSMTYFLCLFIITLYWQYPLCIVSLIMTQVRLVQSGRWSMWLITVSEGPMKESERKCWRSVRKQELLSTIVPSLHLKVVREHFKRGWKGQ